MADGFDDRIQRLLDPGESGPPLTDEAVRDAEEALGVKLPADLLALLKVQNGGYVSDDFSACPAARPTSWADDHVPVDEIGGIGGDEIHSLLESPELNQEWGQPPGLVLLGGDGHTWIALDYRECGPEGEPPVVFYENDSEGSPDELRLASSFREFVELLRPAPDEPG